MTYENRILVYDRDKQGEHRLRANLELLRECGDFLFHPVSRLNTMMNEKGASDLLLADDFAFSGVVVHLQGTDGSKVLEDALVGKELREETFPIVAITAATLPDPNGVLYVHTHAGNGYLSRPEANLVMLTLRRGIEAYEVLSRRQQQGLAARL